MVSNVGDIAKEFMALTLTYGYVNDLDEIIERYMKWSVFNKRPSSCERDIMSLSFWKRFFTICGIKKVGEINVRVINDFVTWRCKIKNISKRTINIDIITIRKILNWAVNMELIIKNPIKKILLFRENRVGLPKYLTKDEIGTIEKYAYERNISLYYAIYILVRTGLRSGELCNLEIDNVDFINKQIKLNPEWTKAGKLRIVPISGKSLQILECIISDAQKKGRKYIFCTETGKKNTPGNLNRRFRFLLNSLEREHLISDAKRIHIHILRATFISHAIMQGESPVKIMAIVGHEEYSTMRRYLSLSNEYVSSIKLPY